MFTILNLDQVQKILKIRCEITKHNRKPDFFKQSFVFGMMMSFMLWLLSGLDNKLSKNYLIGNFTFFLVAVLISTCIFLINKKYILKSNSLKYKVLITLCFDSVMLIWFAFVFGEAIKILIRIEADNADIVQTQFQSLNIILIIFSILLGSVLSTFMLTKKIQDYSKERRPLKGISIIGSAAGLGLLLSNLPITVQGMDIKLLLMCGFELLIVFMLIFFVTLNMIEFLYYIKLPKKLET